MSENPSVEVIFVAGWGRSGSTLLDRLLGSLQAVTSLGEMRDVCLRGAAENRLCGCGLAFLDCPFWTRVGQQAFGVLGWENPEVKRIHATRQQLDRPWVLPLLVCPRLGTPRFRATLDWYAGEIARIFTSVGTVSGSTVLVDSSKIVTQALVLRRAGLTVQLLHLVRDSRAVLYSWQKCVERGDSSVSGDRMERYHLIPGAGRYMMYNMMAQLVCAVTRDSERLRYEDLAASPGEVIGHLSQQLHLVLAAPDLETLSQLNMGRLDRPRPHAVDGNPMRLRPGPLVVRADEEWRQALPGRQRRLITWLTAPLLLAYGYPLRADLLPRVGA